MMCLKPLTIKGDTFSCGQCRECLIKKSAEWSFRCSWENKNATSGAYVTLTYSEINIPLIANGNAEIVATLNKRHLQLFMKKLRKEQEKWSTSKIRFFACGEYGEKSKRPHYHLLIWNIANPVKKKIEEIWTYGFVKIGNIEGKSIRYVTNYMMKKNVDGPHGSDPYFTTMSRRPGIGNYYIDITKDNHQFHEDFKIKDSKPMVQRPIINRFYESKFSPEMQEKIREQRQKNFEEYHKKLMKEAEAEDPLDPLGYVRKQKEAKIKMAKAKEEFKNKNKIKI